MPVQLELGPKTRGLLERVAVALETVADVARKSPDLSTFEGGDILFNLPNDQPDIPFSISPITATDAEG